MMKLTSSYIWQLDYNCTVNLSGVNLYLHISTSNNGKIDQTLAEIIRLRLYRYAWEPTEILW
jgi:hypothetical protein